MCFTEIRCKGLESASTGVSCRRNGGYTPCSNPVPGTEAILFCRNGYKEQTNFASSRVTCNKNGEWSPNPIQCIPGPLMINIYINNSSVLLQTDVQRNYSMFIEVFDDKIVINTNKGKNNDPDNDLA